MWKSMVWPGSIRTSHIRMCSFSNRILSPTWPSVMSRSAAAFNPCLSSMRGLLLRRQHRDGVDLDQVVRRCHLCDLEHGGGRQRFLEVLRAYFVDRVKVLHVAHVDIDAADVVHR